jgi:hypothetical protein
LGVKFSEEDLISYALFPQVALEFFARRDRTERPADEITAVAAVVADLLGVREEAAAAAQAVECAEPVVVRTEKEVTVVYLEAAPGATWTAVARQELAAGRAIPWRR